MSAFTKLSIKPGQNHHAKAAIRLKSVKRSANDPKRSLLTAKIELYSNCRIPYQAETRRKKT